MSTIIKSKIIQLLQTFSPEDAKGLRKFIRSTYFSNRPETVALFECVWPYLKDGRELPSKEQVFKKVFPKVPFDDHRLRMAMSFLYKQACDYLTITDFREDRSTYAARQAMVLMNRNLHLAARQELDVAVEDLRKSNLRNADFIEKGYQLYLSAYRLQMAGNDLEDLNLQNLSDLLDDAYLSRKLWQSCFLLSRQIIGRAQYDFGKLDLIIDALTEKDLEKPAIAIYYYYYRALTDPSEFDHYLNFKQALKNYGDFFPENELRDLFILAVNFCIRQYNAGNKAFLREQFELYREGLAKGYFLVEGGLSKYTYQNAATVALVLKEVDWVQGFILEYKDYLPEADRESMYSINQARLDYAQGKLDEALLQLQGTAFKDIHLGLAARILQMKIYYALNEYDLLESHLTALRTFIQRRKELGYHKENYMNTIKLTQRLLDTNPFDKSEKAALREEIEQTKVLAERGWLLDQLQ